jgi:hypothetical protein
MVLALKYGFEWNEKTIYNLLQWDMISKIQIHMSGWEEVQKELHVNLTFEQL